MEGGVLRYRNPPLHLRSRLDEVLKRAGDSRAAERTQLVYLEIGWLGGKYKK